MSGPLERVAEVVKIAWGVWATQVSVLLQGRGHLLLFAIVRLGGVPG